MGTPTSSIVVMLLALLFIGGLELGSSTSTSTGSIDSNVSCIGNEREALVNFKQSLIDESNRLSSWVGEDCCTWKGVSCSQKAGHVVKLDLHNPNSFNFDGSMYYYDYVANYSRYSLGGEINPSLLNLKHLHYLDLSWNNFSGIQIPEFLGSLKNLRYLNLSHAHFVGKVPHHLGNLSSLQYLDLSGSYYHYELSVDSLWWASTLSSLKSLGLAEVDLSEATDWLHAINMLPSLLELNLAYCWLSSIPPLSHVNFTSHHLGNLSRLQYLDLSFNFELRVDILWWASTLSSLKSLGLAGVNLSEATDWLHAINMLPSLLELNLQGCSLSSIPPLSHVNFTSLVSLDLSWNYLIESSFPLWLSNISGLLHLNLDRSFVGGPIPDTLGTLTSLTVLGLSQNSFNTSMPNWLCKLNNLISLDLRYNELKGSVLPCLGNLTSLSFLDLSVNEFEGEIPNTMRNLCNLRLLDLSYNKFGGEVPIFVKSPFGCPHNSLKDLRLEGNQFSSLPDHFGDYTNLESLYLDDNSISGPIPESIGRLSSLRWLYIRNNKLNGSIPSSFGQLSKLQVLDISFNSLTGMLSECHFAKLASLELLSMSLNSLVLKVSSKWVPPFQLQIIDMASCQLGPEFPPWLQTQRQVEELNISDAGISGTIPDWFEDVYSRINRLDISHNQISGKLPKFQESNNSIYRKLILKSNQFDGLLTSFPRGVAILDLSNNLISGHIIPPLVDDDRSRSPTLVVLVLSNNNLTGGIPTYLCNIMTIQVIDLSKNQLSGRLPWCLGGLYRLEMLDLTNNSLSGEIPTSLGSLISLKSLHLHNNKFHGKLPLSLENLISLQFFDLAKNNFTDIIPPWIGEKLSQLKFLSLQSNNFSGEIPTQLCRLSTLQLLNLAQNNLTGKIPPCFGNFTAMVMNHNAKKSFRHHERKRNLASVNTLAPAPTNSIAPVPINSLAPAPIHFVAFAPPVPYQDKISDTMKGRELEYTSTIPFLTSIDLSNNRIVGEIPKELMDLSALVTLNLAGNHLEGRIPQNIGNLKQLEYLDLSTNKLSGTIPQSLSGLNFLSQLNLSCNDLSGSIPTGNQLQTFDDQSYKGNNGLCGAPLLKSCDGDKSYDNHEHVGESKGEDNSELLWFYAGIGPGFLVGFLGVCGILHFKKYWRYAYFQFLDNTYNRLSVAIAVKVAWLQRKFHKGKHGG